MDCDKLQKIRNINAIFTQNKYGYNKIIKTDDAYAYQEMIRLRYPEKWNDLYEEKWPVRIIYYDRDNIAYIYHFYLYRHLTMKNTLLLFKNFLECQQIAIYNSFGIDIGSNIIKYMPQILYCENMINNFIYIHLRRTTSDVRKCYERTRVPNNMTINKTHGKISLKGMPTESRYTILRIREDSWAQSIMKVL